MPNTTIDSIVFSARAGVTSSAMLAKPENLDLQPLAARTRGFQVLARVVMNSQHQAAPADRLAQRVCVRCNLIADRSPDQVGAVRIETLAHQQVDVPKINVTDVDRDFFGIGLLD